MANNKIGIVLGVNGEEEFKKALRECKTEVKDYKDKLKELDQKFKDGKASVEDYRKKQELLQEKQKAYKKTLDEAKKGLQNASTEYDKQKKKLDELRTALDKAEREQKDLKDAGKEGTEAYKKATEQVNKYKDAVQQQTENVKTCESRMNTWNREIANAEKGVRDCDKEIEKFSGDMKTAGDNTGSFSIKLSDMIKNKVVDLAGDALRSLGEKAIDAAKYIVDVGSSFEAQMSKVRAIAGASAGEAAQLAEKASEMGRTTKFTATEAGEAFEYMAMAGWKTKDMVAGIDGVMALAAASGADLGTTSDIVTDALTAFGQSAEESGRLADIMAAASSNANTNVEMMGETFKYAAPVAGALGYTMEDTSIAIGLMANAGIKASQAGTSLRGGLTNLVKPGKDAATAMDRYKISVTDSDGKMLSFRDLIGHLKDRLGGLSESEQAAAVAALFGKNAMSGWLAIINSSPEDVEKLTTAIDNSSGSAQRMAETMQDNLQGKLTLFNSAMEGLGVQLYNYFSGPLQSVVELATDFINGITNSLTPQKTELESFIDSIKTSNEQVEKSVQHAQQTVSTAETKVAEMEAYKQEFTDILDKCGQFNEIDLGNGYYKIVDTTGRVIEEGFKPVKASAVSTENIIKKFGKDGIKTDTIKEGTELVAEYFDDDGKKIGETRGALDEFGNATIDTTNINNGTRVVISRFTTAGNKVKSLETTVDGTELKFHTDGVVSSVGTITEHIGHITTKVEGVEKRLKTFAEHGIDTGGVQNEETAVIEYFNDVGEKIDEVAVQIGDFGNIQIPTEGLGIEEGTKAVITCFDATVGSVQSFETEIANLQNGEINLNTITTEFNKVEESVRTTYKITDEFTRMKIDTIISNLGGAVGELAEAWNGETGELSASKEELEDWFDTAKEVAMYNALEESIQELYTAWGEAAVNVAKANTAVKKAQEEFDTYVQQTGMTAELASQSVGPLADEYYRLSGNLAQAKDAQAEANGTLSLANEELKTNSDTLTELKGVMGEATGQIEQAGTTAEEAAENVSNLGDAEGDAAGNAKTFAEALADLDEKQQESIETYRKMFRVTDDGFRNLSTQWTGTAEQFADWCEDQTGKLEDLKKTYENAFDKLSGSIQSYVTTLDAADEDGGKSLDNMLQKMQTHMEEMRRWGDNMEFLGQQIGEGFSQEMYDAIVAEGPEKSAETVQMLVDALRSQDPAVREKALETGRIYTENIRDSDGIAKAVLDFASDGVALSSAMERGFVDGSEYFAGTVETTTRNAAQSAQQATGEFAQVGTQAGQTEGAALEAQSGTVAQASQAVVDSAQAAAEIATNKFERVGQVAMTYLTRGMTDRNAFPVDKVREILEAAKSVGEGYVAAFGDIGYRMSDNVRFGIIRGSLEVWRASDNMGSAARNAMNYHVNTFVGAGESIAYGVAQGIWNKQSVAIEAAWNLAWNSLVAAKNALGIRSPSKEFAKVGEFSDEGMASGFEKNRALVENAARQSARAAKEAAEDELTGSDYYTDLTSKINYAGAEQMNRISNMRVETADTASAMRQLSAGISTLQNFAESLQNPQAPNISVMIGNKEFKGYIVRTASEGLSGQMRDIRTGVGA